MSFLRHGILLTAVGCASGGGSTGVLHGDLTVSQDGAVEGVLVWEFFEADRTTAAPAEGHLCARLLSVSGTPVDASDCDTCEVAVALQVSDIEHDCADTLGTDPELESMDRLWIQDGSAKSAGKYPDSRWAWALGWSGAAPVEEGVAWDEGFEFGEPPPDPTVLTGRRVRLAPTEARRLGQ